jgi:rhodanese-related sulfurtransferase
VLGAVVGITGSFLALEALKLILGTGRPLVGRMLLVDGLAGTTAEIPLSGGSAPAASSTAPAESAGAQSDTPGTTPGTTPAAPLSPPTSGPNPVALEDVSPAAVWVDVRRPEESAERPGPEGTVLLPLDRVLRLEHGPGAPLPPEHPLAGLDHRRPLLPFCAAGPRSATAARHLAGLGWPVAGYLDGGLPDPLTGAAGATPAMTPAVPSTPTTVTPRPGAVRG